MAPLAIWLHSQQGYKTRKIGQAVILLNIAGLFASMSRAPMLGFFIGLLIILFGWSRNRAAILSVFSMLAIIIIMLSLPKFIEYAAVTRTTAETADQRNVAYRKEMWEVYTEVVMEKPLTGWGRFGVPAVKGMKSIDSEYLGIALTSGMTAGCFVRYPMTVPEFPKKFRTEYSNPSSPPRRWGRAPALA
jgi:O-antigen ligase